MDIEKLYGKIEEKRKLYENSSLPIYLVDKASVIWFYYTYEITKNIASFNYVVVANHSAEIIKTLEKKESSDLISVDFDGEILTEEEYYDKFLTCKNKQECLSLIGETEEKPFLHLYEKAIQLAIGVNLGDDEPL